MENDILKIIYFVTEFVKPYKPFVKYNVIPAYRKENSQN